MKSILVFVTTLDGKITKWGHPRVRIWSSAEDQSYFRTLWEESNLIVMGSNTFNAEKIKPVNGKLIVVMTRKPEHYKHLHAENQVEFTNEGPAALKKRFEELGYERMTVVGGAHVATSFLKEEVIDEVWLTIEPLIFGRGGNFVTDHRLDIRLHLESLEKVNEQGTLILRYEVLK